MTPKIHVERMMHRNSISVLGESAASYALLKLIPSGLSGPQPNLNLAIVLDVSGSMYEEDGTGTSRLNRIQEASRTALQQLKADDTLSLIAFAHDALVLLPATKISEKAKIEKVIDKIDMSDVDPGGTSMNEGIKLGLEELKKNAGPGRLSQLLILTDGETTGEQDCRDLAQQAANDNIRLTVMGVGLDWKASLLKDLAKIGQGTWHYIDVYQASEAERTFVEEFKTLAATSLLNVELHLRPLKDIKVKRVRQVVPEIKELSVQEPEDRHLVALIGTLQKDVSPRFVIDLSLPKRPDGKYVIAQLEVTYDIGNGTRESTGLVPLEMAYTAAGNGYVNAEVARHIDEVQIFELNNNLQKAIAGENKEEVQRVAQAIEKKGELMGKRAAKKTMLAKQVLQELNVGGRVSKKTQLAMEDSARLAEEMPTS